VPAALFLAAVMGLAGADVALGGAGALPCLLLIGVSDEKEARRQVPRL